GFSEGSASKRQPRYCRRLRSQSSVTGASPRHGLHGSSKSETRMARERPQRIEELFHSAREQDPGQRAAFLQEACAGDEALRQEVESLLARDERVENFLETPALEFMRNMSRAGEAQGRHAAASMNASPAGRNHQDMSGANASPAGRSHQEMPAEN